MFIARVPKPAVPLGTLHQYLFSYFDVPNGDKRPFIFREEGRGKTLCLLSRLPPATPHRGINGELTAGRAYQFDALVSPVNTRNIDGKPHTRVIRDNDERREWLARAVQGAQVRFVQFFDREPLQLRHRGNLVVVHSCVARGVLYVDDLSRFRDFLLIGPGKGKCWGYGLMYLPEVMD